MKRNMKDISSIEDPWTSQGYAVPKHLRESIKSLMESSDEPETRQAWMEHIADMSQCPECEGKIGVIERSSGPQLQCSNDPQHFCWP